MPTSTAIDFENSDELYLAATGKDLSIVASVNWAWAHRWSPIPTSWPVLRDWARFRGLDRDGFIFVARVGARRLHFSFAHTLMGKFCTDFLREYPGEQLLTTLNYVSCIVNSNAQDVWPHLAQAAHAGHAEGIARHIYLTAAYYVADVPDEVLHDALNLARAMSGPDDIVAAYRVVSLMRRVGAYHEALVACDAVNDLILTAAINPVLADHLSERLLAERNLCIELLRLTK